MNDRLYKAFVLNNTCITKKYIPFKIKHFKIHKYLKFISWIYLAFLNLKYRIILRKGKKLYPESYYNRQKDIEYFKNEIDKHDIISFDIFDTLILRSVDIPTEVFSWVAIKTNTPNFRILRINAENKARQKSQKENGHTEINIFDIYKELKLIINPEHYIEVEFEVEKALCVQNVYLKTVFDYARKQGKTVIITSDMYWPKEYLEKLLNSCGYDGFSNIYVSCEHQCGKGNGLQSLISKEYPGKTFLHIGDNYYTDYKATKKTKNWTALHYHNVSEEGETYRTFTESKCTHIYSALVNNRLHSGLPNEEKHYEFGYVYGGLLSYGYTQFINNITKNESNCTLLFTARDSESFFNMYNKYFGVHKNLYFYCSREALLKACLPYEKDFFFEAMFISKAATNSNYSLNKVLEKLDIIKLEDYYIDYNIDGNEAISFDNLDKIEDLFNDHLDEIVDCYKEQKKAALDYVKSAIGNSTKVFVIDLGWRGTVYCLLEHLIKTLNDKIEVVGLEFGSTRGNDISVNLIDSNKLIPYAFSHSMNLSDYLDLKHIMLFEMLFSSEQPSTIKYAFDKNHKGIPLFGESENTDSTIFKEFKQGMNDFAEDYHMVETKLKEHIAISGFDAFLPLNRIFNNYDYIISVYEDLYSKDMTASEAESMKKLLSRFGYTK